MPDELVTPAEACAILKCGRSKAYELKLSIPFYKVGRSIRFKRADVIAYLESQRQCPEAASSAAPTRNSGKPSGPRQTARRSEDPRVAEMRAKLLRGSPRVH